jgi:hypothetical protein
MPGQIKSKSQHKLLEAKAHGAGYAAGPSQATAKKMLADNPVNVKALPERASKSSGGGKRK